MNSLKIDFVVSILGGLFAVAYCLAAADIPKSMLSDEVGPGGIPFAVGITLLVTCILLFFKSGLSLINAQKNTQVASDGIDKDNHYFGGALKRHNGAAVLLTVLIVYVALLPVMGYPLSVTALLFVVTFLAGERSMVRVLLFSVVGAGLLFFIFQVVMGVAMPKGILGI